MYVIISTLGIISMTLISLVKLVHFSSLYNMVYRFCT